MSLFNLFHRFNLITLCLFSAFMFSTLFLTSCCTLSMTLVSTEGSATDVVDEAATNTPTTSVTPTVSIPAAAL